MNRKREAWTRIPGSADVRPIFRGKDWNSCDKLLTGLYGKVTTRAVLLYIPPYSPDLNPIEEMWSKLKAYLRKAKARRADTLLAAITDGFKTIAY
jgi:transposase